MQTGCEQHVELMGQQHQTNLTAVAAAAVIRRGTVTAAAVPGAAAGRRLGATTLQQDTWILGSA
jgi:hypothetical protein